MPEHLVVECLQRLVDWCVKYTRNEDRRGGLPPIPSGTSLHSECHGSGGREEQRLWSFVGREAMVRNREE